MKTVAFELIFKHVDTANFVKKIERKLLLSNLKAYLELEKNKAVKGVNVYCWLLQ